MKRMLKTAAAVLLGASMLVTGALAANTSFSDVPSNHWAYSYVTRAAQEGLVNGMGDGVYGENVPLNIGQFSVMVCQLLYPEAADEYAGRSSYYWYQYAEAAYLKGDLDGTVAGERRRTDGAWTATVVEADMSRYDLAQIIANVMESQGWQTPDTTAILLAMATIPDWSEIPTNYQSAVAMAYAGGFLSGMDDKGTFGGESSMTRAQAAVVLCSMLDAKEALDSPTYTNRAGKLVNGDDANEDNVRSALSDLRKEFYDFYIYDTDRTYTSQRLGTASGEQGFVYMLSDRVFGALTVSEQENPERLKPGDIVELSGEYQLVTDVSGNSYDYVTCDSLGIVYWRTDGDLSDIGSRDTVLTRYEGEADYELDEDRVADLIDEFLDDRDEYGIGDEWDKSSYRSPVLSDDDKVSGSEAFAYYLSDYLFDDADYEEVDVEDARAGDILYLDEEGEDGKDIYGIVTSTSSSKVYFLYAAYDYDDECYYVADDDRKFNNLNRYAAAYTRYDDSSSSSGSRDDLDENDVEDLIDEFLNDSKNGYDEGDTCYESEKGYKSPEFGSGTFYDDQAFAYYMSDYIFGDDQPVEQMDGNTVDIDDIRLGDVIEYDNWFYVVTSINTSKDRMTCLYTDSDNEVSSTYLYLEDFSRNDTIYTRYEGSSSNRGNLDENDVADLIDEFMSDTKYGYTTDDTCYESEDGYESPEFGNKEYFGDRAFAYYMSDYIFGDDQPVDQMDGDEVDIDDIRLGDVILYAGDYYVVIDVSGRSGEIDCLTTNSKNKVVRDTLEIDSFIQEDTIYTRY